MDIDGDLVGQYAKCEFIISYVDFYLNNAASLSTNFVIIPWKEKGKKMSNVWPIAIIGLLTIVILFYALEQCGKIFREGKNLNQRSTQRQNKRKKNHEQYVSVSKRPEIFRENSRECNPINCQRESINCIDKFSHLLADA